MEGKRTLFVLGFAKGSPAGLLRLFSEELAYASASYLDPDAANHGVRGESRLVGCASAGLPVRTRGSLFLDFSKEGNRMDVADGVVGVGGSD